MRTQARTLSLSKTPIVQMKNQVEKIFLLLARLISTQTHKKLLYYLFVAFFRSNSAKILYLNVINNNKKTTCNVKSRKNQEIVMFGWIGVE